MLKIKNTLVSDQILEEEFVCNLSQCKGACCVEGDAGAPLEKNEVTLLKEEYSRVAPYLRPEGREAIKNQGTSVVDSFDGEPVTPLVNGAECAYAVFDHKGVASCGIEKAYNNGATAFQKPISCHLYPIRIQKYPTYQALNYHEWEICSPACTLGKSLQLPVYRFTKDALLRQYGPEWYAELELAALEYQKAKNPGHHEN